MASRCVVAGFGLLHFGVVESMTRRLSQLPPEMFMSSTQMPNISGQTPPRDLQYPEAVMTDWADDDWTTSPYGWVQFKGNAKSPTLYHMHIPKTGGVSFARDMVTTLPTTFGIYSWEACYPVYLENFGKEISERPPRLGGIATMVRKPSDHVFSQYKMCFESDWGKEQIANLPSDVKSMTFSSWLEHFESFTSDDFGCYNPINMQTRSFVCHEDSHHQSEESGMDVVDVAVTNMIQIGFVGIMEHYQESLCLLHVQLELELPGWCNCQDTAAWSTFNPTDERHGTSEHSVPDLTEQDRFVLDKITAADQQLYKAAVDRFTERVRAAEQHVGVQILC